jgi:uncharacterized protein (DUF433 family)
MTTTTEHPYVGRDDSILGGEPIIRGTRTPVRAIVEVWWMGVAPEDITTHLGHLTLAQIFDALSYFADHQDEISLFVDLNRSSAGAKSAPAMQQIQIADELFKDAQRQAAKAGFANVNDYIAELMRNNLKQGERNEDHLFTPERLAHLDRVASDLRNGGKSFTLSEVKEHFEQKRNSWLQNDAS